MCDRKGKREKHTKVLDRASRVGRGMNDSSVVVLELFSHRITRYSYFVSLEFDNNENKVYTTSKCFVN